MLRHIEPVSHVNLTRAFGHNNATCPYILSRGFFGTHKKRSIPSTSAKASIFSEPTPKNIKSEQAIKETRPQKSKPIRLRGWKKPLPPQSSEISEYRLTFGKHRGKKLEEVPLSYLVKYLIPRRPLEFECPIVGDAIEDYMKRNPSVKSQAGNKKTQTNERNNDTE